MTLMLDIAGGFIIGGLVLGMILAGLLMLAAGKYNDYLATLGALVLIAGIAAACWITLYRSGLIQAWLN